MKTNWDASRPLRFADRTLVSEVPLPSLQPATQPIHAATLRINTPVAVASLRAGVPWLHSWPDPEGNTCLQYAQVPAGASESASTYLLRTPGLCDFRVHLDPACTVIDIEHLPTVDAATLEHLLIDQVLPRVIAEQGALVVHASCVRMGDGCALFLGGSGWGKSTLAGLLQRHGHRPLSDDCTVLTSSADQTHAIPTYPSLRLFDDSIDHAFTEIPDLSPVAAYTGKRRVELSTAKADSEIHVVAMYLLNDPRQASREIRIEPVSAATACIALVEQGFRLDLGDHRRTATFLQQAGAVANYVPAHRLTYPRDFAQAEHIIEALVRHVYAIQTSQID